MSVSDPNNFSFRFQKGMTNSSKPSQIIELNYIPSDTSSLETSNPTYQFRSNDPSASSVNSQPESKSLQVDSISNSNLSKSLEKLKELPTEDPVGSEDIYGLDTQIYYSTPDFQWVNGGPGGCNASPDSVSKVQPTKEQKETFKQIVDEILQFSKKL